MRTSTLLSEGKNDGIKRRLQMATTVNGNLKIARADLACPGNKNGQTLAYNQPHIPPPPFYPSN